MALSDLEAADFAELVREAVNFRKESMCPDSMILSLTLRGVAALVGSFWEDSDLMASNFRMWDIVVTCFPPMLQPSSEESSSFLAERVTALWR